MKPFWILLATLVSGQAFAAESFQLKLNDGDSIEFADALKKLGNVQTTLDPSGAAKWTLTSKYETADGAVLMVCETVMQMGLATGSSCVLTLDEEKSQPESTALAKSAVGGAWTAEIKNADDAERLFAKVMKHLPLKSSVEDVSVTMPNGAVTKFPLLRILCKTATQGVSETTGCKITAVPRVQ